jgi:hypothetical protein
LLGALFLVCAVLSLVLAYRRQRYNVSTRAPSYMPSPVDALIMRTQREQAVEKLPVAAYAKPSPDDDPAQGTAIYCSGCAVCLDDFAPGDLVRTLPCKHVYHQACIDPWLIDHGLCPYCKLDIVTNTYADAKPSVPARGGLDAAHDIDQSEPREDDGRQSPHGPVSV